MQTHPKDSMNKSTPQPTPPAHQLVPANEDLKCPHCGQDTMLEFVVDERGPHMECGICAYAWRATR